MTNKPTLVCYSHPPISPGVQFIQTELFDLINVFKEEYDVYVVSRDKKTYDFYSDRYLPMHPEVKLIPAVENYDSKTYVPGMLKGMINKTLDKIDKVFVFSAGMEIVTPQAKLKECFESFKNGTLQEYVPIDCEGNNGQVYHEAEFLATVLEYNPQLYHRQVDYTEPRIDAVTGYPTKTLSYYATPSLKHHKFHDSELFFVSDRKEKVEKKWDFIFGWTVEVPERAYLSDFCFTHIEENAKFQLFVKDKYYSKYAPINTSLKSDTYYDLLRYSKFSLIAPSTNAEHLSLYRVYDDLAAYCIPIFMKSVQYWKGFNDEVNEYIKNNLVYDEDVCPSLNEFISKLDYDKIWNELMSIDFMQKNSDKQWIFDKILEEIV